MPVSYTDPEQSVPERIVKFVSGVWVADGTAFDRDGKNLVVIDRYASAIIAISRDPGYQPPAPAVTLSPSGLEFDGQRTGTTSAAQTVTLTNSGNAPLTISSISASGDFAQTNTCGNSVAVGANCIINVTFTPSAGGTRNGALTISDDAPDSPQVATLAGVGQDFSIGTFTTERTISAGASAAFSLNLAPEGGFAQSVVLTCAGAPPAASPRSGAPCVAAYAAPSDPTPKPSR